MTAPASWSVWTLSWPDLLPLAVAVGAWWVATGVILYLDGLPARTYRWSLSAAGALALGALAALPEISRHDTVGGAYAAFAAALLLWGWAEMSFLMGLVTGPRTVSRSPGSSATQRFVQAVQAIAYHELLLLAGAAVIAVIGWNKPNSTAFLVFFLLWVMRLSAKLNLFLGVRNTGIELLPPRLRYLGSYFGSRPINLLFPFTVGAATIAFALLTQRALAADAATFAGTADRLLAALLGLAILEHWLLVLPLPATALWGWGLASHRRAEQTPIDAGAASAAAKVQVAPSQS